MTFPTAVCRDGDCQAAARCSIMPRTLFGEFIHGSKRQDEAGSGPAAVLLAADAKKKSIPIWLARNAGWLREAPLTGRRRRGWRRKGSRATRRKHLLLPGPEGTLAGAVLGLGEARAGDPMDKPELAVGYLAGVLPPGCYHLADDLGGARAGGCGLGPRRLSLPPLQVRPTARTVAQLKVPRGVDHARALSLIEGSGSAATSSTRRPATWGRRSWRMPPASSPRSTAPACRASSATTCWPRTSR